MQKCSICNLEVKDLQEHMLICENNYISKEFEDLIPCEVCNNLVNFDDYNDHINNCRNPLQNLFTLGNQNQNIDNDNNINNPHQELLNILMNLQNNLYHQLPQPPPLNGNGNQNNESNENLDNNNQNQNNQNINNQNINNQNQNLNNQNLNNFEEGFFFNLNLPINITNNTDLDVDDDNNTNNIDLDVQDENNTNNILEVNDETNTQSANTNASQQNQQVFNFNLNNEEDRNNFFNLFNFGFNNEDEDEIEDEYEELTNLSNTIGNVNVGIKNKEQFLEKKNDKEITCPICVSEFCEYVVTKCNHEFCEECINEWLDLNNNCPLCNYEFIEK